MAPKSAGPPAVEAERSWSPGPLPISGLGGEERGAGGGRGAGLKANLPTVDGQNPFRAALKPCLKPERSLVFSEESNHSRASLVVQDFVRQVRWAVGGGGVEGKLQRLGRKKIRGGGGGWGRSQREVEACFVFKRMVVLLTRSKLIVGKRLFAR